MTMSNNEHPVTPIYDVLEKPLSEVLHSIVTASCESASEVAEYTKDDKKTD